MKVEVVKVTRKYNLGNYESIDVGYEAVLSDVEAGDDANILNCTRQLEGFADQYFQHGRFKRNGTGKPAAEKPQPTVQNPLDQFPESLRQHLTVDGDKIRCEYVSKTSSWRLMRRRVSWVTST